MRSILGKRGVCLCMFARLGKAASNVDKGSGTLRHRTRQEEGMATGS